jgi:hypothetical protein
MLTALVAAPTCRHSRDHVAAGDVALAAIQGLYEVVREKDARITKLENELAELKRAVQSLARANKEN